MVRILESIGSKDYAGEDHYLIDLENGKEAMGEVALWRAVITQALMDAGSTSHKREARLDRAQAIAWLSGTSEDFHEVCVRAELEPAYVRNKAKQAIAHGCQWRKISTEAMAERRKRLVRLANKPEKTKKVRKALPKENKLLVV